MTHRIGVLTAVLFVPPAALYAAPSPTDCVIKRMQIRDVAADGLEAVFDHQAGSIESLELRDFSIRAATKDVQRGGGSKINGVYGASLN